MKRRALVPMRSGRSVPTFDDEQGKGGGVALFHSLMMILRTTLICALTGLLLGTAGCGKKPESPTPPTGTATETTATPAAPEASVDLAALTQAIRRYGMEKQKTPQSLEEVQAAGYLKTIPAAPAGKRFAIEPKRLEVILVNQ